MQCEWRETTIGAVCSRVFSGGTPTSTNPAFYGGGIPWLRTKEVNYGKVHSTEQTITEAGLAASSAKMVPINTVIVAMYGNGDTAGRAAIAKVPLTTNQACCNLVVDSSKADYRFVYYYVRSRYQSLVDLKNGGAQQNLNAQLIKAFPLYLPSLTLQAEIADVLEALDDRIELLRQTNATLESIAQALFKSWFIDFDPVRAKVEGREPEGMDAETASLFPDSFEDSTLGEIPKGWKISEIGQVAQCVGGGTPSTKESNFWEPTIHHWTSPKDLSGNLSPVLLNTERRISDAGLAKVSSGLLPVGTLLMSSRAPIGYLAVAQISLAVNQGYIAMLPGGVLPTPYLYFWCKANMDAIKQKANGSTFMEISKSAFRPIPLIVPPRDIVECFSILSGSVFDRITAGEKQRLALEEIRDTLLPRLISGKLRLPEAEAQMNEALV